MAALARNQASDCDNPELDLFTRVGGVATDVDSLEFEIFEVESTPPTPVKVYPPAGRATVDVGNLCPTGDKLSTGHYVGQWTPPVSEILGTHQIKWYFKLTPSSPEQSFCEEFEVLPEVTGSTAAGYCAVQDLRDEGVTVAQASDNRLQILIGIASQYVDAMTGQFFEPRAMTFRMDGRGHPVLFLQIPIIEIDSVTIELTPGSSNPLAVDLTDLAIYNRHMSQNLTRPDDRVNPKIEFVRTSLDIVRASPGSAFMNFPVGNQNVLVTGTFGYTEYDGSPHGKTPDLICEAVKRLVFRRLEPISGGAGPGGPIVEERTREQTVRYGDPNKNPVRGAFTGDPEIDWILAKYKRPPGFAAA